MLTNVVCGKYLGLPLSEPTWLTTLFTLMEQTYITTWLTGLGAKTVFYGLALEQEILIQDRFAF